ncbi:MAG: hypothetical protein K6B68_12010 [Eubacterium sp.]|nr:hypothetical protein [Eubacterium sp.]
MRKQLKKISTILVLFTTFSLVSCGKKTEETVVDTTPVVQASMIGDVTENTIKFSPNGVVTEIACENYSGSGIDTSSLESYIQKQIDDFNTEEGTNKITFLEYKNDNNLVRTAIQYTDLDAYNSFNGLDLQIVDYNAKAANDIAIEEAAKAAAEKAAEATKTDANQLTKEDIENISEEELAAAGYDLSDLEELEKELLGDDIEDTATETATETATVTDAVATMTNALSNEVVEADTISPTDLKMIVTDLDYRFVFNSGKLLYTNRHADAIDQNTAKAAGDGKAVIVFNFDY